MPTVKITQEAYDLAIKTMPKKNGYWNTGSWISRLILQGLKTEKVEVK